MTIRTIPPKDYLTPSNSEMKSMAEKIGLKTYSKDLAADIANIAAGGTYVPPSQYGESLDKEKMKYHQNVSDFVQSLNPENLPGNTPLEKAMSCIKLLSNKTGGNNNGNDGEPLPIFTNNKPEEVARDINRLMEDVENLSEQESEMLGYDDKLTKLEIAQDISSSKKKLILEISRKLDDFAKLQVRKKDFFEVDPDGEEIRQRSIENLTEISLLSSSDWAMRKMSKTLFMHRALTNQLTINEVVTRQEKKQCIFILVDGSGSMNGERHHKATGIVMNRLKAVLSGDAVVFISVFDTQMSTPSKAETPEEAKALIKRFSDGNFKGGGTDIKEAVKASTKYMNNLIEQGSLLYRPEIVILTDDDNSASSITNDMVKGTRIHGFAMGCKNPSLKAVCDMTGGIMFENF